MSLSNRNRWLSVAPMARLERRGRGSLGGGGSPGRISHSFPEGSHFIRGAHPFFGLLPQFHPGQSLGAGSEVAAPEGSYRVGSTSFSRLLQPSFCGDESLGVLAAGNRPLFRQNTYLQNKKHTLTCQVGLVVTDLITSPVVSWEGWETPPPQHRGSAVILCSTTGVVRPLCSCGDLLLSSARHCLRLVDVDWNTFSLWMSIFLSFFFFH